MQRRKPTQSRVNFGRAPYAGRPAAESFRDVVPIATGLVGIATSEDGLRWEKRSCDGPMGACFAPAGPDASDVVWGRR